MVKKVNELELELEKEKLLIELEESNRSLSELRVVNESSPIFYTSGSSPNFSIHYPINKSFRAILMLTLFN